MSEIVYSLFKESHIEKIIPFITEMVLHSDPVVQKLGITKEELIPDLKNTCRVAAAEGFSFLALDKKSNAIAGYRLSVDFDTILNMESVPGKMELYDTLVMELYNKFERKPADMGKKKILHFSWTGVDVRYRGQGIAGRMIELSVEAARKCGFRKAVCDIMAPEVYELAIKDDFTEIARIEYSRFSYKNTTPLEGLAGEIVLMEKTWKE